MKTSRLLLLPAASLLLLGSAHGALVAHWKLDEISGTTVSDSSGNGYDLTATTLGTSITGVNGTALEDSFLVADATDSGTLNLVAGSVTLSLWAQGGSSTSGFRGVAGFESTGSASDIYGIKLTQTSDLINWTFVGASPLASPATFNSYAAANDGWAHIVGTYDGTTGLAVLYVNGAQVATATNAAGIPDKTPPSLFSIGRYHTNNYAFDKGIDDVQVYDEALSASDVSTLFNNPGTAIPEPAAALLGSLGMLALLRRRR